jgi:16S rRNA U516 pseudouridylate synthase RsuA-like enzyme
MRAISIHVEEREYAEMKRLAERAGRPVASLIREAMGDYLGRRGGHSLLDVEPVSGGRQLRGWTRDELFDEMIAGGGEDDG